MEIESNDAMGKPNVVIDWQGIASKTDAVVKGRHTVWMISDEYPEKRLPFSLEFLENGVRISERVRPTPEQLASGDYSRSPVLVATGRYMPSGITKESRGYEVVLLNEAHFTLNDFRRLLRSFYASVER